MMKKRNFGICAKQKQNVYLCDAAMLSLVRNLRWKPDNCERQHCDLWVISREKFKGLKGDDDVKFRGID